MKSIALLILLTALRAVESSNGVTSKNQLQIREICVMDVNRIYGTSYTMHDVYDRARAHEIAELYLTYWGNRYEEKTGSKPGYEVYARMWNGGPDGWRKKATLRYWAKVRKELLKRKAVK